MKVKNFVAEYKKSNTKKNIIKNHVVKNYVPYIRKMDSCKEIIAKTLYQKKGEHIFYHADTATRYILFSLSLIMLYTDIELSDDKRLEEFEQLEELNIFTELSEAIGKDYISYSTLLQGMIADEQENNGIIPFLNKELTKTELLLNSLNVGDKNVSD